MKSLSLYVDKWYIVGAVTTDNTTRPVALPNREDRIWLFFHEEKDSISYSKHFRKNYHNKENHYYGDVFSLITQSDVTYELFRHSQEMKGIFKSADIFDDLRKDVGEENNIDTFVSFSKDIEISAQKMFLDILNAEGFSVKEHLASIEHLALEYAKKKKEGVNEDGYYLVLNACNENLYYSLYEKSQDYFVFRFDDVLKGYGSDMRSRALVEYVVDTINETERLLQTLEERETEYLRMMQFVDGWIEILSNARGGIPINIDSITFAVDPNRAYSVPIRKRIIDNRTSSIVKYIVREVEDFVNSHVENGQIKGVLFIGSTFTNEQYRTAIFKHYNLSKEKINVFKDGDLSSIVSAYTFIDCKQFSEKEQTFIKDAKAELERKKAIEERQKKQAEEDKKAEDRRRKEREKTENERKFKEAMDKGDENLGKGNYDEAIEYFSIAKEYRPDSEEAKTKCSEALRKKTEREYQYENYKKVIQQAKEAFDREEWEEAKQKADNALTYVPDSAEAKRIKDTATQKIKHAKDFERYIDRADLFIANKLYNKALQELGKAKLLNLGAREKEEIKDRENHVKQEREAHEKHIKGLRDDFDKAISKKQYNEALELCEKLINVDVTNSNYWSTKLADLRIQKEKEEKESETLKKLQKEIDTASFEEDWNAVVNLCEQALNIRENEILRNRLDRAKKKIEKLKKQKIFDDAIEKIEDLIRDCNFKEARKKINILSQMELDTAQKAKIQKIKSNIFKKEDEYDKNKGGVIENHPPFDDFFSTSPSKRKPQKKATSSLPKKEKEKGNSFFESETKVAEVEHGIVENNTNDDFNF